LGSLERPVTIIFKRNAFRMEKVLIETVKSLLTRTLIRAPA
jgi:hypothetical protein